MTDWDRYQKCAVCGAPLGDPCLVLTGRRVDEAYEVRVTDEMRDRPHTGRELRAGGVREGGDRG